MVYELVDSLCRDGAGVHRDVQNMKASKLTEYEIICSNEELGRHIIGREGIVSCVVMSVRVSVMCCGSVQHRVTVELTSSKLGNGFECFDALDLLGK